MQEDMPGSRPTCVEWVAQKAQCSICDDSLPASASVGREPVLTSLIPATLQISVQTSPLVADMACDTDGANAANSIAMQTNHAAARRVIDLITIVTV